MKKTFSLLIIALLSISTSIAQPYEIYGEVLNTNFEGTTLPGGLINTISSSNQNNGLTVVSGSSSNTEYLELDQLWGCDGFEMKVNITINSLGGTGYGLGLGINSTNGFYASSVFSHFAIAGGGLYNWHGVSQMINSSTTPFSVSVGDVVEFKMVKEKKHIRVTCTNTTTGVAKYLEHIYSVLNTSGPIVSNTGKLRLYSFGGGFTINNLTIINTNHKHERFFIGDSMTTGYSSMMGGSFPELVNYPAWNYFGGAGDRSIDIRNAISQLTTQNAPSDVIIMIGVNDMQSGGNPTSFQTNLEYIVDELQLIGVNVNLISPTPVNTADMSPYVAKVEEVAASRGCQYIDAFALFKAESSFMLDPIYDGDTIHISVRGHEKLADEIRLKF